ncbi:outer membrane beta-barrel protein [Hymenobacter sp. HD11105]
MKCLAFALVLVLSLLGFHVQAQPLKSFSLRRDHSCRPRESKLHGPQLYAVSGPEGRGYPRHGPPGAASGVSEFYAPVFQLFPSAGLKRTLSDQHESTLSLSRRIDRAPYSQLNPFREIMDRAKPEGGNPELVSQTSDNVELNHTFRQKYSLNLSYSFTSDPLI